MKHPFLAERMDDGSTRRQAVPGPDCLRTAHDICLNGQNDQAGVHRDPDFCLIWMEGPSSNPMCCPIC